MSEQAILKVGRLTGGYSVNKPVLHDVDFEVAPGEMVGLIGLNGAGKSTTMKHILGLMSPREGEVRIGGSLLKDDPGSYRASLAFVPESPVLYEELTVREHLEFTARAYGVDHAVFEERAERLLKLFLHEGQRTQPVLAFVQRDEAEGYDHVRLHRASAVVCDRRAVPRP